MVAANKFLGVLSVPNEEGGASGAGLGPIAFAHHVLGTSTNGTGFLHLK